MGQSPCHKRGTPCPANALYVIGVSCILIGFLFFMCYCTAVVPEFAYTQDFKKTRCTVESSAFAEDVCCQSTVKSINKCEKNFEYPCLVVNVSYTAGGDTHYAVLYDDYESLAKASPIAKCSYFHCSAQNYKSHKNDAKSFKKSYGKVGKEQPCYYNDKKKKETTVVIGSTSSLVILLVFSIPIILVGLVVMVTTKILDRIFQKEMELLLDAEDDFCFEEEEPPKEIAPPVGPSHNKVSHSDTANTSPQKTTPNNDHSNHSNPDAQASLLTGFLHADRPTDSRPLSNTSKSTQETSVSRATSRPTTGAAVNVEIAEYDEMDESPSFRGRQPAVRFELPKIETTLASEQGSERNTNASPKDKKKRKKKKSGDL